MVTIYIYCNDTHTHVQKPVKLINQEDFTFQTYITSRQLLIQSE